MTLSQFARKTMLAVACNLSTALFIVVQHAAPSEHDSRTLQAPPSSQGKRAGQSKTQKLANPLNDLLDEAQRDIDQKQFDAAITPLQKVLAEEPDFAYGHFQLAYVYTALKKPKEAQAEYERTIALDPKMSGAYVNLGMLLLESHQDAAA